MHEKQGPDYRDYWYTSADGLRLYAQVKSMYFGLHENPLPIAK